MRSTENDNRVSPRGGVLAKRVGNQIVYTDDSNAKEVTRPKQLDKDMEHV